MVYPDTFETKVGFDRIRDNLVALCLSPLGIRKVETMAVSYSAEEIS